MRNIFILLAACALMASCTNSSRQDNGNGSTSVLTLSGTYRSIEVSNAFTVVMSDTATIPTLTIDQRLRDKVDIRIENRTLKIGLKRGHLSVAGNGTVVLPYNKELRSVELSGASHFSSNRPMGTDLAKVELSGASHYDGDLSAATVELELSGASDFSGSVDAGNVDLELGGASHATVSGTCSHELELDISGASNLDASNLDATRVRGEMSGASKADLTLCDELRMDIGGASHLTYRLLADGCSPDIRVNTTGSSTVRER